MPDKKLTGSGRTSIESDGDETIQVPEELMDEVVGLFGNDRDLRVKLRTEMSKVAVTYLSERSVEPHFESPGRQKALIKRLAKKMAEAVEICGQLGPEYLVQIAGMAERQRPTLQQSYPMTDPRDLFARYHDAASEFTERYDPGAHRPADFALEEAVRGLIALIQTFTDDAVRTTQNKNREEGPAPRSAGATAICKLIHGIDGRIGISTIVNMIERVMSNGTPTPHHFDRIFDADPSLAMDSCIHPLRHGNN